MRIHSGSVPDRVQVAYRRAQARLNAAERSLKLLDPDFSRIPQGGDYLGLQRALSKLAHARARVALHELSIRAPIGTTRRLREGTSFE